MTIEINVRDEFTIGTSFWVNIVKGGTGHGDVDRGLVEIDRKVIVIGTSEKFGVLVEYNGNGYGTELTNGSLFFVDAEVMASWPEIIKQRRQRKAEMKQEANRILEEMKDKG